MTDEKQPGVLQQIADTVDERGGTPAFYTFRRNGREYVLEVYSAVQHHLKEANNLGEIN